MQTQASPPTPSFLPPLEVECPKCLGTGYEHPDEPWNKCGHCGGVKFVVTPDGRQVLELLERHLQASANEIGLRARCKC